MNFCPRCSGLLNTRNKGARCFCSDRSSPKSAATSIKEQPPDLFSESWLDQYAKDIGKPCIVTVRRILNQLPPHFLKQGKDALAGMSEPINFSIEDPKERKKIIVQRFRAKSHAIKGLIADLPDRHRQATVNLAWLFDPYMRDEVIMEDRRIQWFNEKIKWEHAWLDGLRALDRLRGDDFYPSDYGFAPDDSLFYTCADHLSIRRNQEQLDRARSIVMQAQDALAFAKAFYLNPHFPRPAKRAVAEACLPSETHDKKKAAARATALFQVIDPTRPVEREDLRQMYYPRKLPKR